MHMVIQQRLTKGWKQLRFPTAPWMVAPHRYSQQNLAVHHELLDSAPIGRVGYSKLTNGKRELAPDWPVEFSFSAAEQESLLQRS